MFCIFWNDIEGIAIKPCTIENTHCMLTLSHCIFTPHNFIYRRFGHRAFDLFLNFGLTPTRTISKNQTTHYSTYTLHYQNTHSQHHTPWYMPITSYVHCTTTFSTTRIYNTIDSWQHRNMTPYIHHIMTSYTNKTITIHPLHNMSMTLWHYCTSCRSIH